MSRRARDVVFTGGHFGPDPAARPVPAGGSTIQAPRGNASFDVACWFLCEIQRLREENEILRQSAHSFGALAERLHQALQRERGAGSQGGSRIED